jgi:hypothetical protein
MFHDQPEEILSALAPRERVTFHHLLEMMTNQVDSLRSQFFRFSG